MLTESEQERIDYFVKQIVKYVDDKLKWSPKKDYSPCLLTLPDDIKSTVINKAGQEISKKYDYIQTAVTAELEICVWNASHMAYIQFVKRDTLEGIHGIGCIGGIVKTIKDLAKGVRYGWA